MYLRIFSDVHLVTRCVCPSNTHKMSDIIKYKMGEEYKTTWRNKNREKHLRRSGGESRCSRLVVIRTRYMSSYPIQLCWWIQVKGKVIAGVSQIIFIKLICSIHDVDVIKCMMASTEFLERTRQHFMDYHFRNVGNILVEIMYPISCFYKSSCSFPLKELTRLK